MPGRLTADGAQHHPARYSDAIVDALAEVLRSPYERPQRPIVDPFAGTGAKLGQILRPDEWSGIEIEPEWAAMHERITVGDALDPTAYPADIGAIVTSPTYGNRMADTYLGPRCRLCSGTGADPAGQPCTRCLGVGRDPTGRINYAISQERRRQPEPRAVEKLVAGAPTHRR